MLAGGDGNQVTTMKSFWIWIAVARHRFDFTRLNQESSLSEMESPLFSHGAAKAATCLRSPKNSAMRSTGAWAINQIFESGGADRRLLFAASSSFRSPAFRPHISAILHWQIELAGGFGGREAPPRVDCSPQLSCGLMSCLRSSSTDP